MSTPFGMHSGQGDEYGTCQYSSHAHYQHPGDIGSSYPLNTANVDVSLAKFGQNTHDNPAFNDTQWQNNYQGSSIPSGGHDSYNGVPANDLGVPNLAVSDIFGTTNANQVAQTSLPQTNYQFYDDNHDQSVQRSLVFPQEAMPPAQASYSWNNSTANAPSDPEFPLFRVSHVGNVPVSIPELGQFTLPAEIQPGRDLFSQHLPPGYEFRPISSFSNIAGPARLAQLLEDDFTGYLQSMPQQLTSYVIPHVTHSPVSSGPPSASTSSAPSTVSSPTIAVPALLPVRARLSPPMTSDLSTDNTQSRTHSGAGSQLRVYTPPVPAKRSEKSYRKRPADAVVAQIHCRWIDEHTGAECGKICDSKDSSSHIPKPVDAESMWTCRWLNCTSTLKRKNALKHMKTVHGKLEQTRCSKCDKVIGRRDSAERHESSCGRS